MEEKDEQGAVHEAASGEAKHGSKGQVLERVSCRAAFLTLPECRRFFERAATGRVKKEFCSARCKDAYHKAAREMGRAAIEAMRDRGR